MISTNNDKNAPSNLETSENCDSNSRNETIFEWSEVVEARVCEPSFRGTMEATKIEMKPLGWMCTELVQDAIDSSVIEKLFLEDPSFKDAHILDTKRANWICHWLGSTNPKRLDFLRQAWKTPTFHPFATITQCSERLKKLTTSDMGSDEEEHYSKSLELATSINPYELPYIIRLSSTQPGAFTVTYAVMTNNGKGFNIYHKRYFIIGSWIVDLKSLSDSKSLDSSFSQSFADLEKEIQRHCSTFVKAPNVVVIAQEYITSGYSNGLILTTE